MAERDEEARTAALRAITQGEAYAGIHVPAGLGCAAAGYKWRQTQSHVEVFVPVPEGAPRHAVRVAIAPRRMSVDIDERPVLAGELFREIKVDDSTWFIQASQRGGRGECGGRRKGSRASKGGWARRQRFCLAPNAPFHGLFFFVLERRERGRRWWGIPWDVDGPTAVRAHPPFPTNSKHASGAWHSAGQCA